ncbi:SDR family oxidoreductase [Thalassospiraceae bacterium LMO-JJ14]|nr:SDR family oxidoreductase [Thalassospiraceae bacterium LMO-JJ14]
MSGVTIVTGGSRGIGAATAKLVASHGDAVCVNYVNDKQAADTVVAGITAAGGKAIAVKADTANEAEVVAMFEQVDKELGPVTGLVNNAGINGNRKRVEELTPGEITQLLAVNVTGCMICAREAIKRMSTKHGGKGGAIVNVSSGSANLGNPGIGVLYATSKGALNSFSIGLSQEVAAEGIRVNVVAPGMTRTDMPGEDRLKAQAEKIPMGRVAEPEEIAEAIWFLLSDKAGYIAGANIRVGGGRL